jgi:hypothetical protein
MGTNRTSGRVRFRGSIPRISSKLGIALVGLALALGGSATAFAFQALPTGAQVNDDPSAGIDPARSVSGEDPTNADVVGGALTAGKVAVPWAIFRQETPGSAQVFSRSFAGGAWTTRGIGTVGGRSSGSPTFSGSLNFDQTRDGEAPSIDFAGAGRTVPWASWYESTTGAGFLNNNVFASRFDNSGDADQGKWIFAGQGRGNGGSGPAVPSLNIHTDQDAENPSLAGGSTADPSKPVPWVTWQETTTLPVAGKDQIFVEKALGPGSTNCLGVTPAAATPSAAPIGGFCWQDTGTARVGSGAADPSLNVDPTRDGIEPDIAFAGVNEAVPWVVWNETGTSGVGTLASNDMVFAAKAVTDGTADGGLHWEAVGSQLNGALGKGGVNGFGTCGESAANESKCSLNHEAGLYAEDPRIAAGTMNSANPTTPWVTWDEGPQNGVKQVFVSRLVGSGAAAHFAVVNGGLPISTGSGGATRPDITFSGNTPYVSWRQDVGGGVEKGFVGHFVNPASPTFVLDESDVPLTPTAQADVRAPISSSCTANPFNGDGGACQGAALGTPFFLFTNGTGPRGLFADGYQPGTPVTGAATGVGSSTATLNATVDPQGAAVNVTFQYGATTAYGSVAGGSSTGVGNGPVPFSAQLTGLTAGATIHYRAVATSDFGTFVGADRTLTPGTSSTAPSSTAPSAVKAFLAKASGTQASLKVSCPAGANNSCRLQLELTVREKLRGHRIVAISARTKRGLTQKTVVVGSASATLNAGQTKVLQVGLNQKGKGLLAHHSPLKARLQITQQGIKAPISTQIVTFRLPKKHRGHR